MRKHWRAIARARMKKAGIKHPNRKMRDGKSYFACYWRKYAFAEVKNDS